MNPKQAAYDAAEQLEGMTQTEIEATVWKRLAQASMGESEANEAFTDTVNGAVNDLSANTANTVGISAGVFDGSDSISDELSSGVFE